MLNNGGSGFIYYTVCFSKSFAKEYHYRHEKYKEIK